jgi:Cu(I)/Ag(I) efflux system membrane fusion protein
MAIVAALSASMSAMAGIGPAWAQARHDQTEHDHGPHDQGAQGPGAQGAPRPPAAAAEGERKILYYRNPMGLPDVSPVPKKDQMGMDYIPVYADEAGAEGGTVRVGLEKVQRLGVRTEQATLRTLVRPIRAVGTVAFDERRTFVVTTKYDGWIERLLVNATGDKVARGQPLMTVYSPALVLAQDEYAIARDEAGRAGSGGLQREAAEALLAGARQRLRYLDLPEAELRRLEAGGEPRRLVTLPAPYAGTVIDKPAIEGMRFAAGEPLYRIVDLSTVWLIAEVFEQDLAAIRTGQRATIRLKAYPDRAFEGRVAYVYPTVDAATRTVRVRIEIANPEDLLKAEMYADVEVAAPVDSRPVLAVPDSAVIDTGAKQVVLIDRGEGRFEPRVVRIGARAAGYAQVLDGLGPEDRVVTAANFLIDAESNLQAALRAFTAPEVER